MRASTLFGMTIAILIGMAVVFGVKSAGLFDKKLPEKINTERPRILVAKMNLFQDMTVTRAEEVMVRPVNDNEMDQYLKQKHKYMPAIPEAAFWRILARNVHADEPLLKESFQDLILPGSFGEQLQPNMKAVNLQMPRDRAGGGIIRKNDIVDVWLTTTIRDPRGILDPMTASALIAPNLKVIFKRDSIWTMLIRDDENKPVPFTLEANPYRAALIEFCKNRGFMTLVPTGATSAKGDKKGVPTISEDKEEEKRIFNVLGGHAITDRDLEQIFKITAPTLVRQQQQTIPIMTERWSGIMPRGGHTFFDHRTAVSPVGQMPGWQQADGQPTGVMQFSNPNVAGPMWVDCPTCPGGKKLVK